MLKRPGPAPPQLRKDGIKNMNAKTDTPRTTQKKHLASYSIWYRVCLVIFGLIGLVNAVGLVGWITGDTLAIFYGIDGLFLENAMQTPYLILYMNVFGIIACLAMVVYSVLTIIGSITDKETTFDKLRDFMLMTALSVWAVPLYHAIADLAMTYMQIRSVLSFDIFDLGMNAWPMLISTVLCIVVLIVNIFLGDVPANAEIE